MWFFKYFNLIRSSFVVVGLCISSIVHASFYEQSFGFAPTDENPLNGIEYLNPLQLVEDEDHFYQPFDACSLLDYDRPVESYEGFDPEHILSIRSHWKNYQSAPPLQRGYELIALASKLPQTWDDCRERLFGAILQEIFPKTGKVSLSLLLLSQLEAMRILKTDERLENSKFLLFVHLFLRDRGQFSLEAPNVPANKTPLLIDLRVSIAEMMWRSNFFDVAPEAYGYFLEKYALNYPDTQIRLAFMPDISSYLLSLSEDDEALNLKTLKRIKGVLEKLRTEVRGRLVQPFKHPDDLEIIPDLVDLLKKITPRFEFPWNTIDLANEIIEAKGVYPLTKSWPDAAEQLFESAQNCRAYLEKEIPF